MKMFYSLLTLIVICFNTSFTYRLCLNLSYSHLPPGLSESESANEGNLFPLLDGQGHPDSSRLVWGPVVEVHHRPCDQDLYRSGAGLRVCGIQCELLTGWAGVCNRQYTRHGEGEGV